MDQSSKEQSYVDQTEENLTKVDRSVVAKVLSEDARLWQLEWKKRDLETFVRRSIGR